VHNDGDIVLFSLDENRWRNQRVQILNLDNIWLKIVNDLPYSFATTERIDAAEKSSELSCQRTVDFATAAKIRVNIMTIFVE